MSTEYINISFTENQLATIISGLLFSCSVNVVSNVNEKFFLELFELAKNLKTLKPEIKLDNVQFVKEKDYEDQLSDLVLEEFHTNMQLVTFEQV
jgi:hypothetical protein